MLLSRTIENCVIDTIKVVITAAMVQACVGSWTTNLKYFASNFCPFPFALNLFPLYDLFFLVALSLDALLISLVLS